MDIAYPSLLLIQYYYQEELSYIYIYQSASVLCVFISAERVFSAEEGSSSTIRWSVTAWLVLERRQTVCLGTHTICSSLVSTSFPSIEASLYFIFFSLKLNQISLGVGSGWLEDLPSLAFIIRLQILFDSLSVSRWPSSCFSSSLGLALGGDTSRIPSAVGAWQWCIEPLCSHWWSHWWMWLAGASCVTTCLFNAC